MRRLEVLPFSPERVKDYFTIHSETNDASWCYCTAWWVPSWDGWGERTASENFNLRQNLLNGGIYDGYMLYVDGKPAAWCQVGQRDRLTKLVEQFELELNSEIWAITCFLVAPSFRHQGLATYLLDEILRDLMEKGVSQVEAYPRFGNDLDETDLWNGPESMFLGAGFKKEGKAGNRLMLRKLLND